jgi:molybdenum cofactor cytidylyltransferase
MIAAVILAAGESARFGRPKQLLAYRGRTLLRHVVECAVDGGCDPVIVVLGARADELRPELEATAAEPVLNAGWREGIGSSVRAGVEAVESRRSEASAVLLLTCDQPRITPELVQRLGERFGAGQALIVACEYAGTVGVPALFHRSLYPELRALSGSVGAKPVLEHHREDLVRVPWPEGAIDIDLPEDYERLEAAEARGRKRGRNQT